MKTVTRLEMAKTLFLLLTGALCVGCGGPSRVEAPELDSKAAASEAMALYDQDGDGQLTDAELKASGALLGAKAEIDEDEDGNITEAEIESRIDYFIQGRDGRISLACYVIKGNTPVPGADVRFVPEPFMADMIEGAMGTTNEGGMAIVNMDDQFGGVQPGFYKVEISKQSRSGKESIKKKYNEETILGQEVTSGSIQLSQGITFKIR